jgi:hypothetical protein
MPASVQDEESSVSTVGKFVVELIFIWGIKVRLRVVLKECPRSIQIWTTVAGRARIVVDEFVVIVSEEYR